MSEKLATVLAQIENGERIALMADDFSALLEQHYTLTVNQTKLQLAVDLLTEMHVYEHDDNPIIPYAEFRAVIAKLATWHQDVYLALTGDEDDRVKDDPA